MKFFATPYISFEFWSCCIQFAFYITKNRLGPYLLKIMTYGVFVVLFNLKIEICSLDGVSSRVEDVHSSLNVEEKASRDAHKGSHVLDRSRNIDTFGYLCGGLLVVGGYIFI